MKKVKELSPMQKFSDRLEVKPFVEGLFDYRNVYYNDMEFGSIIEMDFEKYNHQYLLRMLFNNQELFDNYKMYGEVVISNELNDSISIPSEETNFVDDIADKFVEFIQETEAKLITA
jgi:hypothetical protein